MSDFKRIQAEIIADELRNHIGKTGLAERVLEAMNEPACQHLGWNTLTKTCLNCGAKWADVFDPWADGEAIRVDNPLAALEKCFAEMDKDFWQEPGKEPAHGIPYWIGDGADEPIIAKAE